MSDRRDKCGQIVRMPPPAPVAAGQQIGKLTVLRVWRGVGPEKYQTWLAETQCPVEAHPPRVWPARILAVSKPRGCRLCAQEKRDRSYLRRKKLADSLLGHVPAVVTGMPVVQQIRWMLDNGWAEQAVAAHFEWSVADIRLLLRA